MRGSLGDKEGVLKKIGSEMSLEELEDLERVLEGKPDPPCDSPEVKCSTLFPSLNPQSNP